VGTGLPSSAADQCLVLDGVYRCDIEGEAVFVEVPAPTDEALQAVLHKIITRSAGATVPLLELQRRHHQVLGAVTVRQVWRPHRTRKPGRSRIQRTHQRAFIRHAGGL